MVFVEIVACASPTLFVCDVESVDSVGGIAEKLKKNYPKSPKIPTNRKPDFQPEAEIFVLISSVKNEIIIQHCDVLSECYARTIEISASAEKSSLRRNDSVNVEIKETDISVDFSSFEEAIRENRIFNNKQLPNSLNQRFLVLGGGAKPAEDSGFKTHFDIEIDEDTRIRFQTDIKNLYFLPEMYRVHRGVRNKTRFKNHVFNSHLDEDLKWVQFDVRYNEKIQGKPFGFDLVMALSDDRPLTKFEQENNIRKKRGTPILIDPKLWAGGGQGLTAN